MKNLELKFDLKIKDCISKRNAAIISYKSDLYEEFWLRVLTNHKVINTMISESDREALKHLKNVSYTKLDDGNVI